jgi:hypothetical protein
MHHKDWRQKHPELEEASSVDLSEGRFVYHGTSSIFLHKIRHEGLKPGKRKNPSDPALVHVTRDQGIAGDEAMYTVHGDVSGEPGVGGDPVIVKIDRFHPSFRACKPFRMDSNYHMPGATDIGVHDLHSFAANAHIPPEAIVSFHKVAGGGKFHAIGGEINVTEKNLMTPNDISIAVREAELFLDEEDSLATKAFNAVSQGASNLYTGARDTAKALFSAPKDTGPSIFSQGIKNVMSGPASVKGALDTTMQKATTSASTPMRNSVDDMISRIVEGKWDAAELERLYGGDFKSAPKADPKSQKTYPINPTLYPKNKSDKK